MFTSSTTSSGMYWSLTYEVIDVRDSFQPQVRASTRRCARRGAHAALALLLALTVAGGAAEACTIGVARGRATVDGRPLLWKVRDNSAVPDNEVYYNDTFACRFVAVVTANGVPTSQIWMGANEYGFALVNANADDLADSSASRANGKFMRDALGSCRSVAEFIALLETTSGRRDTRANFGVIDSTGAAFVVEASNTAFWTYDAEDAPAGFLVRTNFACNDTAAAGIDGLPGAERFVRATNLIARLVDDGALSCASLVGVQARDFSDWASRPIAVPCLACDGPDGPGIFDSLWSICSNASVSAAVVHGVAAPEPAWLTTLWVHLGVPACTLASPYWPVGATPAVADGPQTAPLCDLANGLRAAVFPHAQNGRLIDTFVLDDGDGGGLWSVLLPAETRALAAVEARLEWWRQASPPWSALLAFEDSLAVAAHAALLSANPTPVPPALAAADLTCHPNPFNPATTLAFTLPHPGRARLDVFDLAGRRVARLLDDDLAAGAHRVTWRPAATASGVYVARLAWADGTTTIRLALVR